MESLEKGGTIRRQVDINTFGRCGRSNEAHADAIADANDRQNKTGKQGIYPTFRFEDQCCVFLVFGDLKCSRHYVSLDTEGTKIGRIGGKT